MKFKQFPQIKSKLGLLVILTYSLSTISCIKKAKPQEFVQPTVLEKNSAFDISKLNFNENVLQLVSKSLDTADTGFNGKDYEVFSGTKKFNRKTIYDNYIPFSEKRYFFPTRDLDSIAQFDSLYFYRVGLETDKDKKLVALTANAKFKEKKDLDKFLSRLFKDLGKTTEEVAIKADDQKLVDEAKARGLTDKEIDHLGYNQGSQYNLLDYGDEAYFEWKLKDRYVQVSLSKDREIQISTNAKENFNIEYLYVDFLVIRKDEYEKIEKLQYQEMVKLKKEIYVLKPYELRALKPQDNQRFYKKLLSAWGEK